MRTNKGRFIKGNKLNCKGHNDYIVNTDGTTRIMLTQGMEAIITTDIYPIIKDYRWYASRSKNTFYAISNMCGCGDKNKLVKMHQLILPTMGNKQVDHVDGNGLNNTTTNLRLVTPSQNLMNRGIQSNNKSGHTGVCWYKGKNKWIVNIKVENKSIHLGYFTSKEDAIATRKEAEHKYFKEFARAVYS